MKFTSSCELHFLGERETTQTSLRKGMVWQLAIENFCCIANDFQTNFCPLPSS